MYRTGLLATLSCLLMTCTSRSQGAPHGPLLALPDPRAHHITLLDTQTRSTVAVIPVTGYPHELSFSPDGRLMYAPSYSDHVVNEAGSDGRTIDVIDMTSHAVLKTWDLGRPLRPHRILTGPDGTLFVSTELGRSISIVDPGTGKLVGEIPTGAFPSHMFVLTPDGKKIYTSNLTAGTISVLDVPSRKLLKVIPVSTELQRLVLSSDGRRLFVADRAGRQAVAVDTATDTVVQRSPLGGNPFSVALSPDGQWLLTGEDDGSNGKLEVLDTRDLAVKKSFRVDAKPYGIRVLGDHAFVNCNVSGNLNILNLHSWTLEQPVPGLSHGDGIAIWPGISQPH